VSLMQILQDLSSAFSFAADLIVRAHLTDPTGTPTNTPDIRAFMTEAAVLKCYIGWERFLEQSFAHYMLGAASTTGKKVVAYAQPPSIAHALRMPIGTQRYMDWGNPQIVLKVADLFLENGEPYKSCISAILSDLTDMRAIRNAAAHLSTSTSEQLDKIALRRLNRAQAGITVYELVTAPDPSGAGHSLLESYTGQLAAAATHIAAA
jgi:hypothetical protein